ncbi:hypothetical protein ACK8P5_26295 (plasmid) [Paenibacillus sp. EC2-1]|uniref:hypothetical protein n=1 Tax=Paenibacillus sp. EC2-1 TaxID=3388665 RepID=UPI003BEEFFA8
MNIDFHNTRYGRTFFEHQLPELIRGINRLADQIERYNEFGAVAEDPSTDEPQIKELKSMANDGDYWVGQEVIVSNNKCGNHNSHVGVICELYVDYAKVLCTAKSVHERFCGVVEVPYCDLRQT